MSEYCFEEFECDCDGDRIDWGDGPFSEDSSKESEESEESSTENDNPKEIVEVSEKLKKVVLDDTNVKKLTKEERYIITKQNAKEKYKNSLEFRQKKKEYYEKNKEKIKERQRNRYRNLSPEQKFFIKERQRKVWYRLRYGSLDKFKEKTFVKN